MEKLRGVLIQRWSQLGDCRINNADIELELTRIGMVSRLDNSPSKGNTYKKTFPRDDFSHVNEIKKRS